MLFVEIKQALQQEWNLYNMKVAIYSRGLDVDQEGHLLTLLEELTRNHIKICLYKPLLDQHESIKMLPTEFSVFTKHERSR